MVRSKTKTTLFLLLLLCFTVDAWWGSRRRRRRSPPPADTTPPSFKNCRSPWTVTTPTSSATVTWKEPTGFEQYNLYEGIRSVECTNQRCFGERQVPTSRSGPPPGSTFREGQHSIVYTATDNAGNTARCTISFRVRRIRCSWIGSASYRSYSCSNSIYVYSRCRFYCSTGYYVSGYQSVTCNSNGYWSGRFPYCIVQRCINPPTPTYGSVSCSSYNHGATCHFRCESGYSLLGSSSITCQEGVWSGSTPTCAVRRCPVIVPPENALPSNCGGTPGNLATFGSVCTFYCPHGFNPGGHDTVKCQADGTWSEASFACEVAFETDDEISGAGITEQGSGTGILLEEEREDGLGDHNTEHESDSDIYFVRQ